MSADIADPHYLSCYRGNYLHSQAVMSPDWSGALSPKGSPILVIGGHTAEHDRMIIRRRGNGGKYSPAA